MKVTLNEANIVLDRMINNLSTLSRQSMLNRGMDGDNRDLARECGWIERPTIQDFRNFYNNDALANRVNNVYPDECWSTYPTVYEDENPGELTPFEKKLNEVLFRLKLWSIVHRADRLSGIGRFGVMLLGLNDNAKSLEMPVSGFSGTGERAQGRPPVGPRELLFVKPFSEDLVRVSSFEDNFKSPRYGQPKSYSIDLVSPNEFTESSTLKKQSIKVHWTRVIHLAEHRESSDIYAVERLRPVLPRIQDLRKILGGSAEMLWLGGFPGFAFETLPEVVDEIDFNKEQVREQIQLYIHKLQRYLTLQNVTVKQLSPQVANPTQHFVIQIQALCAAIGVPMRIFLGSEAAHLASTQDTTTWNRRLGERRENYLTPLVIDPLISRLVMLGVLPVPKEGRWYTAWQDLNALSDKDRADMAVKMTQALLQYVTSGAEKIMPFRMFLTMVMRYTDHEAAAIVSESEKSGRKLLTRELWESTQAKDQRGATDPAKRTGASGRRNGMGRSQNGRR